MIRNKKYCAIGSLLSLTMIIAGCAANDTTIKPHDDNDIQQEQEEPTTIDYTTSSINDTIVYPLDTITITTNKDKIDKVSLYNVETGKQVEGEIVGNTWKKTGILGYGNNYHLTAQVGDKTLEKDITTPKPITAEPVVSPLDNSEVGVGQTISVKFDVPVPDKKAVEDSIEVETTPHVEGKFRWVSPTEVRWRPEHFWEPGTQVKVNVNTYGKYLQEGIFGGNNATTSFTISKDSTITTIDDNTKTAIVRKNGEIIRQFPVSMGKDSMPTNNGIYILGDHNDHMIMDSNTYGLSSDSAEGYITPVDYATQMSYSGIYLHSAPWAIGALGAYNQSHGCINATPEDAKWFLDNTKRGDIVIVKNTIGETLPVDDGLGDWNSNYHTDWS